MAQPTNQPAWVDLSSGDTAASRAFYSRLFGWDVQVNEDPQYGGYGVAKVGGKDAAGIGGKMDPNAPTVWSLYIGTDDIAALAQRVRDAGGTVTAEPFDIGDQGRMAVFQDPRGAYICAWEAVRMRGFETGSPGSYAWGELNARGVDGAIPFYTKAFGWETRTTPMGDQPPYTEFLHDGQSIAGAWEMNSMVPAEVPSYWQIYFAVEDVDASTAKALELGARELVAPRDFPGGRFSIVSDPEGASFGLLKMAAR